MCSLSPYGVAVGFFYDTTSRITVVVEALNQDTAMNLQYSGFCCCCCCCFVFFLRKLNRFIVSFFGFFLFCFALFFRFEANTCPPSIKLNWLLKAIVIVAVLLQLDCTLNKGKLLPWKTLNGKISVDKSRGSTIQDFLSFFQGIL